MRIPRCICFSFEYQKTFFKHFKKIIVENFFNEIPSLKKILFFSRLLESIQDNLNTLLLLFRNHLESIQDNFVSFNTFLLFFRNHLETIQDNFFHSTHCYCFSGNI
jgi:hypothetical protein